MDKTVTQEVPTSVWRGVLRRSPWHADCRVCFGHIWPNQKAWFRISSKTGLVSARCRKCGRVSKHKATTIDPSLAIPAFMREPAE